MADTLQLRGGSTAQCIANVPAAKEVWVDTSLNTLRIGDGAQAGGHLIQPAVINYAGNPNGNVAGVAGVSPPSVVWDSTDNLFWVCTTGGIASAAVWKSIAPALVGDTGSGGAAGIAPAPAAGDAAANKVLGAGGAWVISPVKGFFFKSDSTTPAFSVTGAGTISVKAGTIVEVAGLLIPFTAQTAVVMPSLTLGTDYSIYGCTDGTIRADASFTAPSGYTTANIRQIGGFHYAPGGNAAAMAGGNTTPAINPYSVWDLKWKPKALDPRGLTLVANTFWRAIYLFNTTADASGASRYGLPIASGSALPKVPAMFGGNGSTTYGTFDRWTAAEALGAYGLRLPTLDEFMLGAYGTTEESSLSADPVTTGLSGGTYTSKWGVIQSTGCYWEWARDFGGPYSAASWAQTISNRGQFYEMPNAGVLGGNFGSGADSGSRASHWGTAASSSNGTLGARGCCDHVILV